MVKRSFSVTVSVEVSVDADDADEAEQIAHDHVGVCANAPDNIGFVTCEVQDVRDDGEA